MISDAVFTATPVDVDHVFTYKKLTQDTSTKDILHVKQSTTTVTTPPEDAYNLKVLFYKSYDPSVGYNTAALLGGLLIAVLMYVFYRTKIRKPLIQFCKRKFNELFKKKELENGGLNTDAMLETDPCEKPFLPVAEEGIKCVLDDEVDSSVKTASVDKHNQVNKLKYQLSVEDYSNIQKLTITNEDHNPLPFVFMDVDHATADWVHKQHQYLEPGGIILKVKSDTICPPNNEIQPSLAKSDLSYKKCCMNPNCRLNTARSHFGARSQNALNLNKSMPMFDIQDIATVHLQNEMPKSKRHKKVQLKSSKVPSISSEPKTPTTNRSKHPSLITTKCPSVSSEPKSALSNAPMHLTPIIKIQNIEKTQRNDTEVDKAYPESVSSSSSDEQPAYRIPTDSWQTTRPNFKRSMTEETPQSTCRACNHTQFAAHRFKQLSLEDACQMGLLIPANKLSQSSLSCKSTSNMETPL